MMILKNQIDSIFPGGGKVNSDTAVINKLFTYGAFDGYVIDNIKIQGTKKHNKYLVISTKGYEDAANNGLKVVKELLTQGKLLDNNKGEQVVLYGTLYYIYTISKTLDSTQTQLTEQSGVASTNTLNESSSKAIEEVLGKEEHGETLLELNKTLTKVTPVPTDKSVAIVAVYSNAVDNELKVTNQSLSRSRFNFINSNTAQNVYLGTQNDIPYLPETIIKEAREVKDGHVFSSSISKPIEVNLNNNTTIRADKANDLKNSKQEGRFTYVIEKKFLEKVVTTDEEKAQNIRDAKESLIQATLTSQNVKKVLEAISQGAAFSPKYQQIACNFTKNITKEAREIPLNANGTLVMHIMDNKVKKISGTIANRNPIKINDSSKVKALKYYRGNHVSENDLGRKIKLEIQTKINKESKGQITEETTDNNSLVTEFTAIPEFSIKPVCLNESDMIDKIQGFMTSGKFQKYIFESSGSEFVTPYYIHIKPINTSSSTVLGDDFGTPLFEVREIIYKMLLNNQMAHMPNDEILEQVDKIYHRHSINNSYATDLEETPEVVSKVMQEMPKRQKQMIQYNETKGFFYSGSIIHKNEQFVFQVIVGREQPLEFVQQQQATEPAQNQNTTEEATQINTIQDTTAASTSS